MPDSLAADDPNLIEAIRRHRRMQLVWAALVGGMAVFTYLTVGPTYPLAALPWLLVALALVAFDQPPLLAVASALWALSLIHLVPDLDVVFGPDPIARVLEGSAVETFGRAAVRVGMALTAWNQFMLYRWLYGSEQATGLPDDFSPIPRLIDNRTSWIAWSALALGIIGVVGSLLATAPLPSPLPLRAAQLGFGLGQLAIGLALGAAFSPTAYRRQALGGLGLGMVSLLLAVAVGGATFG